MGLLRTELYKITARRTVNILLIVLVLFFGFYFWVGILGDEVYTENGKIYTRLEAIQKEKELSETYEGKLDMDSAREIIRRFGWAPDWDAVEEGEEGINDNFWNRYVTLELSTRRFRAEGEVEWLDEENVIMKQFASQDWNFGYTGGWDNDLIELLFMALIGSAVLIVIGISPVYSEEYSMKTADLLMSSCYGKDRGIAAKIIASLIWSTAIYLICVGGCLLMTGAAYGTEGLSVSAAISFGIYAYKGTAMKFLMRFLGFGLAACHLHTIITLFASAKCRQPFWAVIWGIGFYLLPVGSAMTVLSMLRPTPAVQLLRRFCRCFPYFLPINEIDIFIVPNTSRFSMHRFEGLVCILLFAFCLWRGCHVYKKGRR